MILLSDTAMGHRPLVGCYYAGDQWVPCSWLGNGQYVAEIQRALDIIDY